MAIRSDFSTKLPKSVFVNMSVGWHVDILQVLCPYPFIHDSLALRGIIDGKCLDCLSCVSASFAAFHLNGLHGPQLCAV